MKRRKIVPLTMIFINIFLFCNNIYVNVFTYKWKYIDKNIHIFSDVVILITFMMIICSAVLFLLKFYPKTSKEWRRFKRLVLYVFIINKFLILLTYKAMQYETFTLFDFALILALILILFAVPFALVIQHKFEDLFFILINPDTYFCAYVIVTIISVICSPRTGWTMG